MTNARLSVAAAMLRRIAAVSFALLPLAGCEVDSSNASGIVANNSGTVYDFSGLYSSTSGNGQEGGSLVYPAERQSGTKLTWLRIVQDGSSLQGYDNAGMKWHGSIASVEEAIARFSLEGSTTAGAAVTVAGTMTYSSGQSTISAAWLESGGFSGSLFAVGSVSAPTTNVTSTVHVSPTSATLAAGESRSFTASGGNGSYVWTHSGSCGTLSSTSGSTITYTHSSKGTDTLTVTSAGDSASAAIVCE